MRIAVLVLGFTLVTVAYLAPLFRHPHNLGIQDWDQHLFYQEVPRLTVLEYGQFPLWNPYQNGGLPCLANPQTRFLSPTFLLVLAAGTVVGIKLEIAAHYVVGLLGAYLLGRSYALTVPGACVTAIAYMFSGLFAFPVAAGMPTFLAGVYVPWLLHAARASFDDVRWAIAGGLVLALMLFAGGVHLVMLAVPFLAVWLALEAATGTTSMRRAASSFVLIGIFGVLLSAIKLVPMLELMRRFPRVSNKYSGYSLESLAYSLLAPGQALSSVVVGHQRGLLRGMSWGMDENGCYVGFVSLALCGIGVVTRFRRQRALAIASLIALWASLGDRVPLSLWGMLHRLPVFDALRVAQRFRWFWLLGFALFAGMGLDEIRARLARSAPAIPSSIVSLLALVLLGVDLRPTARVFDEGFSLPPVSVKPSPSFQQISTLPYYDASGFMRSATPRTNSAWSALYPAVRAGVGTIDAYEPITTRFESPAVARDDPRYRGEAYVDGGPGDPRIALWSPNRVRVETDGSGFLLLNQNYIRGWQADGKAAADRHGLIGAPIRPNVRSIDFEYHPTSFRIGVGLSLVGAVLALWLLIDRRRAVPSS